MTPSPDQVPDETSSGPAAPGAGRPDELALAVGALADEDLDKAGRRKLLGRMLVGLRERGVKEVFMPRKAINWITEAVSDLAPHVPVRNLETLRRHYPGLSDDALAERLIRNAARAAAGVGAVGGGMASIEWAVPPTLLSTPVLLATETVGVVGIELKLIGELHEVYGQPVIGTPSQRAVSLMQAWASHRGISPMLPGAAAATVLGTATRKQLRDMVLKRFGRNLTTLGPLLTGAAIASYLNRKATRRLGNDIRNDLRLKLPRPVLPPGSADAA
ncbi:hypothetical protein Cme02nite_44330 [Catellatospora methionotrophica]|uniref:EcsC family protein n=1 Tax=Catellatospora methionotrophica TaxID=121620 RepID=A0A8J3LJ36_9ACTN|nr:hypothetical protein [Catellatospora methionotrophica]GIG16101.1 hypothetical protein Cme02nite_44330 [Catellatospora methionotrophica]